MATPRNNVYSAASGGAIYAGKVPPSAAPAWMSSAVVGAYTPMPSSTGAGGSGIDAFCDFVVDDQLRVWIAAAGGHGVSDNRVVKYDAGVDTPTGWVTAIAPSPVHTANAAYEPDGKPGARHTYNYTVWAPGPRKVLLIGCYGTDPDAYAYNTIDGVTVDGTPAWDPAGTHPYTFGSSQSGLASYANGVITDESTGAIFWNNSGANIRKWTPGSAPVDLGAAFTLGRFPTCFDSLRTAFFNLQYGDGQGFNPELGLTSRQTLNPSSGSPTARTITFNSSAALTQLLADAPVPYAGMNYDSLRDKFLFVYGASTAPKLIEITPNSGTTWDMAIRTPTGSVGNVGSAGMQGRVKFVTRGGIGGFLILPSAAAGLYFLRTQ